MEKAEGDARRKGRKEKARSREGKKGRNVYRKEVRMQGEKKERKRKGSRKEVTNEEKMQEGKEERKRPEVRYGGRKGRKEGMCTGRKRGLKEKRK